MKSLFTLILLCVTYTLSAEPYYSEYRGNGYVISFRGEIRNEDEPLVRNYQTKYLESLPYYVQRRNIEMELNKLGVSIEMIKDNPYIHSEKAYPYYTPYNN